MGAPENLRKPIVNLICGFGRESPPQSGGERDADNDRHEDIAHAIAKALDVGATGLRAPDGGDDVSKRGAFAGGDDAHSEAAIEIHGAGEKLAANFFINWNGFAGKRGFINHRIAFNNNSVNRHAVAGTQNNFIADF